MIISKIRGGLGNQLFQWASGHALAKKHDTELFLDISTFQRNKTRKFELTDLGMPFQIATLEDIERAQSVYFYKQPSFHYDPNFNCLQDGGFIRGYFNSERYFLGEKKSIKRLMNEVIHKQSLSENQQSVLDQIRESDNSVSIHVRRGDYVTNPSYSSFFGTCGLDYYSRAISYIESLVEGHLSWFVFSDDLEWARENLPTVFGDISFVDVNSKANADYLDLFFMSACDHNIIANSTFSWWASWTNSNKEKIVVAPMKWFSKPYREKAGKGAWIKDPDYSLEDLFPDKWVKL